MNHKFDTLYARDSKGKVLKWDIEVQNNGQIDIKVSYGEYNGSQALRWQRDIQGVNIGKSNETNPYEQAVKECKSKIARQKKKGYMTLEEVKNLAPKEGEANFLAGFTTTEILLNKYLPKNRTDAGGNVKPMKCQQYYRSKKDKETKTWVDLNGKEWLDRKYYYLQNPYVAKETGALITKFPCYGQPKFNGVRALIFLQDNQVTITSKEGDIKVVAHINDFFNLNTDIFTYEGIDLVLDGELYIHGELLQDIGSAINKPNLSTHSVTFQLFDLAIEGVTNADRWSIIKEHIKPKLEQHINCPIEISRTVLIKNDAQAQAFTDKCIEQGYEGAIFRQPTSMYGFGKRPVTITKLKRSISSEFKIIDIVPQKKDRTKGQFKCITKEGLHFDVNPMGNDAYKRSLLSNRNNIIGKALQCSFYEWTKDLKPFHIIENTIRDYE